MIEEMTGEVNGRINENTILLKAIKWEKVQKLSKISLIL
jgi:hypothetical protein